MSKRKGKLCGLVIAGGFEREAVWFRTKKKRYVKIERAGKMYVYAPTKRKAVKTAHRANVRAVSSRGNVLVGLVGGWHKLARYQFKHGLPE